MELDEQDLREGLKFIVGTWQVDYIVNAFSNDLAHIPATEWKSEDGTDFTAIEYEFFEDHTMVMRDSSKGRKIEGTWEQTSYGEYKYTVNDFFDIPDSNLKKALETLMVQDGHIVFSIAFLAVAMKKIAEGTVTPAPKKPDIKDAVMSPEDMKLMEIAGKYAVAEMFSFSGEAMEMMPVEKILAELDKKVKAGEADASEIDDTKKMTGFITVFTEDHMVQSWMPVPEGLSQKEIDKAIAAGEIREVRDGLALLGEDREWKAVDGKYYYDTGEQREMFGEPQSSWDELTFDEKGLLNLNGFMKLKRI